QRQVQILVVDPARAVDPFHCVDQRIANGFGRADCDEQTVRHVATVEEPAPAGKRRLLPMTEWASFAPGNDASALLVVVAVAVLLAPAIGLFRRLLHRALFAVVLRLDRPLLAAATEWDPAPARLLGRLGQRDGQHAVLEVGGAGLLVDVRRER